MSGESGTWIWEVYVRTGERRQRLVVRGQSVRRFEAMLMLQEVLPSVKPLHAFAYGIVVRTGARRPPRPLKLTRVRGRVVGWTSG